ncbi:MAG: hypothetical protein GXO02_00860 [Epsilonproteobacteria bacterium]|nr:hypothetical protein [Campylobacterota bacterium]
MNPKEVYFLPGRRSKLTGTIGQIISDLGYKIYGREVLGEFEVYPIQKQIEIIANDIKSNFWDKEAKIIGRSYGGYLIMHTIIELLPDIFPGKILLLGPVLGKSHFRKGYCSRPPRAYKLLKYAKEKKLDPFNIEIYTGKEDIGCDYKLAEEIFKDAKNSKLHILENITHYFPHELNYQIIKSFLES